MKCPVCGAENPANNQFCNSCGKPLASPQPPVNRIPAGAGIAPVLTAPKGSGIFPIILIGGVLFILAVLAVGFFVILPLLGDESPQGEYSGDSTADIMTADDPGNDNAAESSGSLLSGTVGETGTSATSRAASSGPQAQSAAGSVVHGTISTGTPVMAAQGSIPASGGTITVTKTGSPIDGLKFTAPPGAYPSGQQVTISSAPVTGTTFGNNFNPITPLISIEAGKEYADTPVFVTIPVQIPDDQFAMAFYYDDISKRLEGVPTSRQDSGSITIATRHFSNIIVSAISANSLDGIKTVDSGFRPGVDDWEFVNEGSYIAPDGHCAGQSVSMMWYYTEQRQKMNAPHLFNRYDNNGRESTPKFERDDTLGYRFASVIQTITDQQKYWDNPGSLISNVSGLTTFREFKYSMFMTGEPQYMGIFSPSGSHAIVCYKVTDTTLWIADPNYPGKERTITLARNALNPYSSGANSRDIKAKGVTIYSEIDYIAKSAMFSWPMLTKEYAKVSDGTIGDGTFPAYEIVIKRVNDDGTSKEVSRIKAGKNPEIKQIDVDSKTVRIAIEGSANGFEAYHPNGSKVAGMPITLNEGSNVFAIEASKALASGDDTWLGFDWITINYKPLAKTTTPTPTPVTTITTQMTAPPSDGHYTAYRWYIPDSRTGDQACKDAQRNYITDSACSDFDFPSFMCGQPPAHCIDTSSYKNGLVSEYTYTLKTKTTSDGKTYYERDHDGWDIRYNDGGRIAEADLWKDGLLSDQCMYDSENRNFFCTGPDGKSYSRDTL
jgi:hypothetical protein